MILIDDALIETIVTDILIFRLPEKWKFVKIWTHFPFTPFSLHKNTMYILISPAKNLNETPHFYPNCSQAQLLAHSQILIEQLKTLAPQDIAQLMSVSDKIARLNTERFQNWQPPFTEQNAKAAVFLFNGDVYDGLDAATLPPESLQWLQQHSGILSGLYGLLRPLDLIQPYRLEMGTKLANPRGADLYTFWGDIISQQIQTQLQHTNSPTLINLASQEYFKSVKPSAIRARIITPVFQDQKNGQYRIISFYAKRARGLMLRYAAENRITDSEQLKKFDSEGYTFCPDISDDKQWIFRRCTN